MNSKIPTSLARHWKGLVEGGEELVFRKGQALFYEGHTPYGLFVLQSGKLRFTKGGTVCKENHLESTPAGEAIDIDSFFSGKPYCCSCTAIQDCTVTFVPKSELLSLL